MSTLKIELTVETIVTLRAAVLAMHDREPDHSDFKQEYADAYAELVRTHRAAVAKEITDHALQQKRLVQLIEYGKRLARGVGFDYHHTRQGHD